MATAKKTKKTATKKKKATSKKKKTAKKDEVIEEFNPPASGTKYLMKETFELEQWLEHPKFGIGMVEEVMSDRKIRVRFAEDTLILVHNFS